MSRCWAGREKGGLVRLHFAPLFWLTAGALALALQAYTGSSRFRARLSSDRLAEIRKANGQRIMSAPFLLAGLYCTYAAIRTMIGGVDTWWLWILAAATQFVMFAIRRAAGANIEAGEVRPREKMQRRHRRALWFFGSGPIRAGNRKRHSVPELSRSPHR